MAGRNEPSLWANLYSNLTHAISGSRKNAAASQARTAALRSEMTQRAPHHLAPLSRETAQKKSEASSLRSKAQGRPQVPPLGLPQLRPLAKKELPSHLDSKALKELIKTTITTLVNTDPEFTADPEQQEKTEFAIQTIAERMFKILSPQYKQACDNSLKITRYYPLKEEVICMILKEYNKAHAASLKKLALDPNFLRHFTKTEKFQYHQYALPKEVIPRVQQLLAALKQLTLRIPEENSVETTRDALTAQQAKQLAWVNCMMDTLSSLAALCGSKKLAEVMQNVKMHDSSFKPFAIKSALASMTSLLDQYFTNATLGKQAYQLLRWIKFCPFIESQLSPEELEQVNYQYKLLARSYRTTLYDESASVTSSQAPSAEPRDASAASSPTILSEEDEADSQSSQSTLRSSSFSGSDTIGSESTDYDSPPDTPASPTSALLFAPTMRQSHSSCSSRASCNSDTFAGFTFTAGLA